MNYEDPTLNHLVTCQKRLYKDSEVTEHESIQPIPEELVEQIESCIGDGQARVTVSGTLSSNVDYHKAEAFVSISIPCNSNLEDIGKAHDIVRAFVGKLLQEDLEDMKRLRDQSRQGIKTSSPPKAPQLVAQEEPEQRVINRPSFRR